MVKNSILSRLLTLVAVMTSAGMSACQPGDAATALHARVWLLPSGDHSLRMNVTRDDEVWCAWTDSDAQGGCGGGSQQRSVIRGCTLSDGISSASFCLETSGEIRLHDVLDINGVPYMVCSRRPSGYDRGEAVLQEVPLMKGWDVVLLSMHRSLPEQMDVDLACPGAIGFRPVGATSLASGESVVAVRIEGDLCAGMAEAEFRIGEDFNPLTSLGLIYLSAEGVVTRSIYTGTGEVRAECAHDDGVLVIGYESNGNFTLPDSAKVHGILRNGFVGSLDKEGRMRWITAVDGIPCAASTDEAGNVLVASQTEGVVSNQRGILGEPGGQSDVFVYKLDRTGNPVWGRYLGGAATDTPTDVAVSSEGAVYVSGLTQSPDFPVVQALSDSIGGGGNTAFFITSWLSGGKGKLESLPPDGFLTKLDQDGEVIWSTFVGGTASDILLHVRISDESTVWVSGSTSSNNIVLGNEVFETGGSGKKMGVLLKISEESL